MPLCKRCDQFFHVTIFEYTRGIEYGEGSITDHYPHQLSLPTFLEAVDQKCFVCWRIFYNSFNCRAKVRRLLEKIAHATSSLESVAEWSQPQLQRCVTSIFGSFNRIWPKFNKGFLHELKASHKSVSELWSDIEAVERLFKPEERDEMGRAKGSIVRVPREQLYMNTPLSISTASNQTFLNISTWIRRCEVEHARCTYFRNKASWYPSRLLDVGTQGNTTVRLVRGGQNIAQGQTYMTLSHRWGAYKVPTLSTKTITAWSEGLSIKALPKTFQDFITLARFLQVRYVWIDSLCIIQEGDSGADWRSEGLTMDQVYRSSYCNISADWGSDKRGLFFQRDVRMLDKPRVDLRVKKEPNWDSIVTEEVQLVESEFWEDPVSKSPLSTRGWVVQERWLSLRNVRFGPREVFFECNQHALCERFPENLPQVLSEGDNTLKAIFSESQIQNITLTISVTAIPGTPIYNAWHEVLSRYSRCYLTFASDRLIAFAGIAKFFQEIMGDKYIEGLWLRNLAYDMMWFRDLNIATPIIEGHNDRIRLFERDIPGQYRAPSFSWASTRVPIKPPSRLNSNLGFLVTVKCIKFRRSPNLPVEEITEDVFGPMLSPTIEVMVVGCLRRMRLLPYFNGYQRELYVTPDNPDVDLKNLEDGSKNIPREIAAANLDFQILYDDIATWMSKRKLVLYALARSLGPSLGRLSDKA